MNTPTELDIVRLLIKYYSKPLDLEVIKKAIEFNKLLWKLRDLGEYNAAVEYLAKKISEHSKEEAAFTSFCDAAFFNRESEEQKIAYDAVEIVRSLKDEHHYIFSAMRSEAGIQQLDQINALYACPRGLRYQALFRVVSQYREANVVDIGCSEARLEEHCNILNTNGSYRFNVADRSSYILLQAKYRNRANDNIKYFSADFANEFLPEIFQFERKAPLIVIVSEFIEHMEKEKSISLLKKILRTVAPDELLITTPNNDYSVIYKRDDPNNLVHIFEYTYEQFAKEMESLAQYTNGEYCVSDLYGIAGKPNLPQSLFVRIKRR